MGRAYAGILGPLAFALSIGRGLVHGWSAEGTLQTATAGLFLFAAFGYIAGRTAEYLIRDSVQNRFQSAMADWKQQQNNTTQQNTTT